MPDGRQKMCTQMAGIRGFPLPQGCARNCIHSLTLTHTQWHTHILTCTHNPLYWNFDSTIKSHDWKKGGGVSVTDRYEAAATNELEQPQLTVHERTYTRAHNKNNDADIVGSLARSNKKRDARQDAAVVAAGSSSRNAPQQVLFEMVRSEIGVQSAVSSVRAYVCVFVCE